LLLPILYVDVPGLTEDADDQAMRTVVEVQWEDWRELRLEDPISPAYRTGVHDLATRLKDVAEAVVARPVGVLGDETDRASKFEEAREAIAVVSHKPVLLTDPEELGLVDVLAEAEEALPRLTGILEEMGEALEEIGRAAEDGTAVMEASANAGEGFAARLRLVRDFSQRLEAPSELLLRLSSRYASELTAVDAGFTALIDLGHAAETAQDRAASQEFFTAVRGMSSAGRANAGILEDFLENLQGLASFSRDLRPPLQRIQDALRRVLDGQAVMDDWVRRVDRGNDQPGAGSDDEGTDPSG
jgi:hypothetical protein